MLDQNKTLATEAKSFTGIDGLDSSRTARDIANGAQNMQTATADALEGAANRLHESGKGVGHKVAGAADRTAAALTTTADYVREFDARNMMEDVTEMAKRHPGKSLAVAAALGFMLARSMTRSYE